MIDTIPNKPQVGDLVCDINFTDWEREFGIITLIETGEQGTLYFIEWTCGTLMGYTTAHHLGKIKEMLENVHINT